MNELLNKTLAQIVTANHQAATVFEKYHLDFCCKGKRPLSEALTEKHLSTEQVIGELNEVIGKSANKDAAYSLSPATHQAALMEMNVPLQ